MARGLGVGSVISPCMHRKKSTSPRVRRSGISVATAFVPRSSVAVSPLRRRSSSPSSRHDSSSSNSSEACSDTEQLQ